MIIADLSVMGGGALLNILVVLGLVFLLSRSLTVLRGRHGRQRTLILGLGFGASAIGSMMVSFPIADGIIGDLRNAVIGVAALVGGPLVAILTATIAAKGCSEAQGFLFSRAVPSNEIFGLLERFPGSHLPLGPIGQTGISVATR